jgi:hypothetical protein
VGGRAAEANLLNGKIGKNSGRKEPGAVGTNGAKVAGEWRDGRRGWVSGSEREREKP